jgi:phosphatidylserine/phosphatidylglycerophosphate/cardiolipin synthase-like enzyme
MSRFSLLALCSLICLSNAGGITQYSLSPQVQQIYQHVMTKLEQDPSVSPTPPNLILTSGRFQKDLAAYGNTTDFPSRLFYDELIKAQEEVLVSTMIFDSGFAQAKKGEPAPPTPSAVRRAIEELDRRAGKEGRRVRFYLAYDPFGTAFFAHTRLPPLYMHRISKHPERINLPAYDSLKNIDFKVVKYHYGIQGALHSKYMLIDGHTTIMGSKNLDADVAMEYMLVVNGQVTRSLRADFGSILKEPLPELKTSPPTYDPAKDVPILVVSRMNSVVSSKIKEYAPQNEAWLKAVEVAQKEIYVQTPDFATKAIAEAILDAVIRRPITVKLVVAFHQEDKVTAMHKHSIGTSGETMNYMYNKLKTAGNVKGKLEWCWFVGQRAGPNFKYNKLEWSHVKFMAVDGKFAMVGSGNQDPQTWYHSREVNILIDDAKTTQHMLSTLQEPQQSLEHCYNGSEAEKDRVV